MQQLYIILLLTMFYFYMQKKLDFLILTLLIFMTYYNTKNNIENFTTNEAIQNLASMYNSEEIICKKLTVTGDINTSGNINISDNKTIKCDGILNLEAKKQINLNTENINSKILNAENINSKNMTVGSLKFEDNKIISLKPDLALQTEQKNGLVMQGDNNLVYYINGRPKWSSGM